MKSLTLLFLSLSTALTAQTWFPNDARWDYDYLDYWNLASEDEIVTVVGDTLLGGQNAKHLQGIIITDNSTIEQDYYFYEEDDTVYFWNESAWQKIYDFNLQVGDILQLDMEFATAYTVLETGEITVFGENRKYQRVTGDFSLVDQSPEMTLVEGVGAIGSPNIDEFSCSHLVPNLWACISPVDGTDYKFQCYSVSDDIFDPVELCLTNLTELTAPSFSIYPNPAKDFVFLKKDGQLLDYQLLQLLDFKGQSVFKTQKAVAQIDVSTFPSGIYFVHFLSKDGQLTTKKLVIQQ